MLGTAIAYYKITAKLGQGGMGEVYRATDTKLDRDVAIKVLPEAVAQDKERLARFEREAKVLAQLNHPNIAGVYGLEQSGDTQALILELVEGEDLSVRLKRGPLPVDESLEVSKQIAEALEAAHEKGIIHRDLKPGNIKLTADGKVKVLDFGLAKALSDESDTSSVSNTEDSPTITEAFTKPGAILGTAAYMSPEQARGKHVDKRTDIWAFGCVLFECLTGKKAFQGEDVTDTLAAIIKGEPIWQLLPPETPPWLDWLLRKCLTKTRKNRLQDIGDARICIEQIQIDPLRSIPNQTQDKPQSERKTLSTFLYLASLLIVGLLGWFLRPNPLNTPSNFPSLQFQHTLKSTIDFQRETTPMIAISPDASRLVYAQSGLPGERNAPMRLVTLNRGGIDEELKGTEGGKLPVFSPDGKSLLYLGGNPYVPDKLNLLDLTTMESRNLQTLTGVAGISFLSDETLILAPDNGTGGLLQLALDGNSPPKTITSMKDEERSHRWPECLPGGEFVLFMAQKNLDKVGEGDAEIVHLATGNRTKLVEDCIYARYSPSGHLFYIQDGSLFARSFDLASMTFKGNRRFLRKEVAFSYGHAGHYAISGEKTGVLVYLTDPSQLNIPNKKILWIDLKEENPPQEASSVRGLFEGINLSPNGRSIALSNEGKIEFLTSSAEAPMRFEQRTTFAQTNQTNSWPVWLPDSTSFVFHSQANGKNRIMLKQNPIATAVEFMSDTDVEPYPLGLSADGKWLLGCYRYIHSGSQLWMHSLDNLKPNNIPSLDLWPKEGSFMGVCTSPDGKWMAYLERNQLKIRSLENAGDPILIPGLGHISTRKLEWSKDSNHIIYYDNGNIWKLKLSFDTDVPAPIDQTIIAALTTGAVQARRSAISDTWDLNAEEDKLLVLANDEDENTSEPTVAHILVHLFSELKESGAQH